MKPNACPRFDHCNAPICPLDADWHKRTHHDGEPVCLWLRELSKPGGERALRGVLTEQVTTTVATVAPRIIAKHGRIRRALMRASQQGSKLAQGRALRGAP